MESVGLGIGNSATPGAGTAASATAEGAGTFDIGTSALKKNDSQNPTDPQFGDVLSKIQAQYGAKPQKPREIKKELGKDDFLRIMVTQMKNQDPTNPFKAEQMAAQMAQFASLEQLHNMNTNLTKMTSQSQPLERLAMTNLIGKYVTVDKDRFPHTQGQAEALSFHLPRDAKQVHVTLVSEQGEIILEQELGTHKAGEGTFNWDGNKANTLPAKSGTYMLRVDAFDDQNRPVFTDSQSKARVVGISFEGSEPVLLIGDSKRQEKVVLKNVSRIEDNESGVKPLSSSTTASPSPNVFSFQPGVGSQNIDASKISSDAKNAIQKFESEQTDKDKSVEKGFPNGLQDSGTPSSTVAEAAKTDHSKKGGESK